MYSKLQLLKKFIQYRVAASNGKGHGVHSPFVYEFIRHVLNDDRTYYCYQQIEQLREKLKQDDRVLTIEDFGAGSRVNPHYERSVSSIAKSALKQKKFSQLLFRMINYYRPQTTLELGTSLGITTAYLAAADTGAKVITMEGAQAVADVARKNFQSLNLHNISLVQGNFDDTLPPLLQQLPVIDFAFIDGNHRKDPTVNYYHKLLPKTNANSILIFDDIHWSEEMEAAWEYIKNQEAVTLSIDLFFIGIVFFRKESKVKQHFTIKY
ncbi:O-methyltransferase [Foetidibacter luteolus]|uniref:O-methyltransferase n=1 Tax=Foetidibacter luteolus TaxID=2608880 RepID=UPI00129AE6AC|nr:class I SAM-dependent methyltransferase [Foetidibacter luteolus]